MPGAPRRADADARPGGDRAWHTWVGAGSIVRRPARFAARLRRVAAGRAAGRDPHDADCSRARPTRKGCGCTSKALKTGMRRWRCPAGGCRSRGASCLRWQQGEHYRDDLVGFEVVNAEGVVLGRVEYFADLPAGAVMVVKGEREHLVPASPRHLLKIDADARRIDVDWPAELRMKIEVVTLFPELIQDALRHGVTGRAIRRELLSVGTEDPRAHTSDVHRTVDDRPYGGGPGMVLKPEPLTAAIAAAAARVPAGSRRIYLSAQGARFDQARAEALQERARPGAGGGTI